MVLFRDYPNFAVIECKYGILGVLSVNLVVLFPGRTVNSEKVGSSDCDDFAIS